jgi:hypothetical protein
MKKLFSTLVLLGYFASAQSGIFSSKEGVVFQTKGTALILTNSTFTTEIERRYIPIPSVVDLRVHTDFQGLIHDSESGWTKCRVPLKGELGWTGLVERSLVFDCKPLQYYK